MIVMAIALVIFFGELAGARPQGPMTILLCLSKKSTLNAGHFWYRRHRKGILIASQRSVCAMPERPPNQSPVARPAKPDAQGLIARPPPRAKS